MKQTFGKVLMLVSLLFLLQGSAYSTTPCATDFAHLTVTKTGTGDGTVSTGSGGSSYCEDAPIKTAYPTAAADGYATFTGWSIDCSGTASPTSVYMNTNKTCTATFTCNYGAYRINNGTPANYESIQAAYNAMPDEGTLDLQALTFSGNLTINDDKTVALSGGYGCGYATDTGFSTVSSTLTITAGTATVEYMKIK
jgi:hypothetical protein